MTMIFQREVVRGGWLSLLLSLLLVPAGLPAAAAQHEMEGTKEPYAPVHSFDPQRDAALDVESAMVEAGRTGRRVLLELGGDWCPYCAEMEALWKEHPGLRKLRDERYVTVYVAYGTGSPNTAFLASYPKLLGVPHFYILKSDGTVLQSEHVRELREGGSYSPQRMREFLLRWSAKDYPAAAAAAVQLP
jgi:thiol:disulfide interchange protein